MMTQVSLPTCVAGVGICAGVSGVPATESVRLAGDRSRPARTAARARGSPQPRCRQTRARPGRLHDLQSERRHVVGEHQVVDDDPPFARSERRAEVEAYSDDVREVDPGGVVEKVGRPDADGLHLVVPPAVALIRLFQTAAVRADVDAARYAVVVANRDGEREVAEIGHGVRMVRLLRAAEREVAELREVVRHGGDLPFHEMVGVGPVENHAAGRVGRLPLRRSIERIGRRPEEVAVVVVEPVLGHVLDVERDGASRTARPGPRLRLVIIDDEVPDRGAVVVFERHDDTRVGGRNADRPERLVLPRKEVERRDVPLHVVLDQRQHVAELDQVRGRASDPAGSGEDFARGRLVVKIAVAGALNDRSLVVAGGAIEDAECLTAGVPCRATHVGIARRRPEVIVHIVRVGVDGSAEVCRQHAVDQPDVLPREMHRRDGAVEKAAIRDGDRLGAAAVTEQHDR